MYLWHQIFLKHPYSTDNPQGYWEHGMFSTGDIKPVHWEYIYPDRKEKKELFRPKQKQKKIGVQL